MDRAAIGMGSVFTFRRRGQLVQRISFVNENLTEADLKKNNED